MVVLYLVRDCWSRGFSGNPRKQIRTSKRANPTGTFDFGCFPALHSVYENPSPFGDWPSAELAVTVPALGAARPADPARGNTIVGDTGIWFVPTGETLPKGKWSGGVQLREFRPQRRLQRHRRHRRHVRVRRHRPHRDVRRVRHAAHRRRPACRSRADGQPQDYLINKGWSTGFGDVYGRREVQHHFAGHDRTATRSALRVDGEAADGERGRWPGHRPDRFPVRPDRLARVSSRRSTSPASAGIKFRGQPGWLQPDATASSGASAPRYPSRSQAARRSAK